MYQWDLKDIIHSTLFLWTTDGTSETNTSANEIVENAYFLFSKYLRQFQQKLLVFLPPFLLSFFFSSFTSFLCGQKTPISSFLIGNKCLQRLADFCKSIRRWQLTLLPLSSLRSAKVFKAHLSNIHHCLFEEICRLFCCCCRRWCRRWRKTTLRLVPRSQYFHGLLLHCPPQW